MDWNFLHKYLSGESDPEEMQEVESWLRADEQNKQFFNTLEQIWEIQPADEIEVDAKEAWGNFQKKMSEKTLLSTDGAASNRGKETLGSGFKSYKWYRRAPLYLSAAAVLILAFLFYRYVPQISLEENLAEAPRSHQVVTDRGQRTTMQLVDGTRIQLNANSRLTIPPAYNDSTRTVLLEGEGFFEVVHDTTRPFIVKSGGVYTKVLGTKFGVRAYSEDEEIQVVVAEGKVAMGVDEKDITNHQMYITRNQKGIISQLGISEVTGVDDIEQYLGWRNDKLVFNDLPLEEGVTMLERWYDVEITLKDSSIAHRRLKATFTNEPITEVLNVIALSLDLEYKREGQQVILRDVKQQ